MINENIISKNLFNTLLKAFSVAFIINFVVYLPDLAHMPLSDHDLGYLSGISYVSGGGIGRWFLPFIYAVRGFELIPIFVSVLAFFAHISAGMAAVYLWYKNATFIHYLAGGLFISLIPFSAEHYFFHWQADSFAFAQLFIILSIILSSNTQRRYIIVGTFLTTIALATYQSSIQTAAVCWMGMVVLELIKWDGEWLSFKEIFQKICPSAVALFLGSVLYGISIAIIKFLGLIRSTAYQLEVAESTFFERVCDAIVQSYMQFWYSQPFFPKGLKIFLLVMTIVACGIILFRASSEKSGKTSKNKIFLVLLSIIALILVSKVQSLVVSFAPYTFRLLATSLSYLYLFFFLVIISSRENVLKYVSYAFGVILFLSFSVLDLKIQYSFIQQNTYDYALMNRVVYRIEGLENFDAQKKYTLVILGVAPMFNSLSFDKNYEVYGASAAANTLTASYPPGVLFSLLTPYIKTEKVLSHYSDLSPELVKAATLAQSHKAYPAKDSCFIYDDTIVVVLDSQGADIVLDKAKKDK